MTADDARALVKEAKSGEFEAVKRLMSCWNQAIERAARAGKTSVRAGSVFGSHSQASAATHDVVHEALRCNGFKVANVQDGVNEYTIEVSW